VPSTMDKKIKILHLEDSLKDSELIHSIIECGGIAHEYFIADNEKDFKNILEIGNIDIKLSDYSLSDYSGNEAFKFVREIFPFIPFIFVSGTIGEDAAINAMSNGATDYVLKNKLQRLAQSIKRALKEIENYNIRKEAEEALRVSEEKFQSIFDQLDITKRKHSENRVFKSLRFCIYF
jgi:DNA-binding NtrC family response regulator